MTTTPNCIRMASVGVAQSRSCASLVVKFRMRPLTMRVTVTAVTMTAVIGKLLNLAQYWCGFCVLDMLAVPITDLPASDVR